MPAPKRPNYFQSQFLVVRDFTEEQDYHRQMLQLHNQLMHDWGVVGDGLKVTGSGVNLSIGAGSAIDSFGQAIVLEADTPIKVPAGQDVWITIAFQELNSTDKDDKYPPPGGSEHVTRLVPSPLIAAITTAPPTDGKVITLAKVSANGTVDYSVRKLASSFMRVGGANDLSIGPGRQVGIGTADPRGPLHIKGDVGLLNLEGDTHGFVQFYPKGFDAGRKGWLGFGSAGDSDLRIQNEADGGNVVLSSVKGYVGISGSAGGAQGIQFGNREIKFRGDGQQHFSIFANKVSKALTFARSGSTENMDTVDANIMTLADSGNVGIGTTTPEGQLQVGDGWNRIGIGPTPDNRNDPTLYNTDYGTAYLGFNAVRTAQGWRRSGDGGNNGGSLIYNRIQGELCFVTLEKNDKEFLSDGEIKDRKRMVIDATGKVSIAKDLNVAGALSVGNGINLNNKPLTLRADNNGPDINHGLAYFGAGASTMGDFAMDGPVLYGSHGGALGTYGAKKIALRWDDSGNVGIGTQDPSARLTLKAGAITFTPSSGGLSSGTDLLVSSANSLPWAPPINVGDEVIIMNESRRVVAVPDANRIQVDRPFGPTWLKPQMTVIRDADVLRVDDRAGNPKFLISGNGRVGIGTNNPQDKLTINGGALSFQNPDNPVPYCGLDYDPQNDNFRFLVNIGTNVLNTTSMVIARETGWVGIGTTLPKAPLDMGNLAPGIRTVMARLWEGNDKGTGTCLAVNAIATQSGADPNAPIVSFAIEHYFYGIKNGYINFCRGGSSNDGYVRIGPNTNLSGKDVAELFSAAEKIEPGDVVVFDEQAETVKRCASEADGSVIGIVSHAPAAVLGDHDGNSSPIALCGRVPCNVDADIAPIRIGDLLTTSPTRGHAQKVQDASRAAGSIIGKALGSLSKGKGQITVLVALA
jgi:hypothetical protein